MRLFSLIRGAVIAGVIAFVGAGVANAVPTPDAGPVAGGTDVTVEAPVGVTFTQVSVGGDFSLALGDDGSVYGWGANSYGELADGTNTDRTVPVRVLTPAGVQFTQIYSGEFHALALSSDGTVYSWGRNSSGQLGISDPNDQNLPVVVDMPVGVTVTQIAAGYYHSVALGDDGTVYAWGGNTSGQLGDGGTTPRSVPAPAQIPGGLPVAQIAAGGSHSLAIAGDGSTYAWGENQYGQLGDSSYTSRPLPVLVAAPVGVTFTHVTAGSGHTLAIGSDTKIYGWGLNAAGQVGDNTKTTRTAPVEVQLPPSVSFTSVSAGGQHSLAIGSDGNTYAWGQNTYGKLGDGTAVNRSVPVPVLVPAGVKFTLISNGYSSSVALGDNGTIYAWGRNQLGQLGNGTNATSFEPGPVIDPAPVVVTGVTFGGVDGEGLRANADGTYTVTTPMHAPCAVDVTVSWTLAGVVQQDIVYSGGFTYLDRPTITDPDSQSVTEGMAAVFWSSTAACPAAELTWEFSVDAGASWEAVSGLAGAEVSADGTSLQIAPALLSYDGYVFRAVATNSEGAAVSGPATLTVVAGDGDGGAGEPGDGGEPGGDGGTIVDVDTSPAPGTPSELPNTGSQNPLLFGVAGLALVGAGIALVSFSRRRSNGAA